MAAVVEVEPTPSCSHHSSSKEIEYDIRKADGIKKSERKDESGESSESSDEEASERVRLKPPLQKPFQPNIELENREVVFAIAVFLLVGVTLGIVLFICTWKTGEDKVRVLDFFCKGGGRKPFFKYCESNMFMSLTVEVFNSDD